MDTARRDTARGEDMRSGLRSSSIRRLALALALTALVTACSGVPNLIDGSEQVALSPDGSGPGGGLGGDLGAGGGFAGEGGLAADGSSGLGAADGLGSGPGGSRGTSPGQTGTAARPGGSSGTAPRGQATGQSGQPVTAAGHGPGVTDSEILIALHVKLDPCGNDPTTQSSGAVNNGDANNPPKFYERLEVYTRWFNEHVAYPGGRKLRIEVVDDGGADIGCVDKARAAALRIAREIRPFAAIGTSVNLGADVPVVADIVNREGIIHIGINYQTEPDAAARHPFGWSIYSNGEQSFTELVWFIERRLNAMPYRDSLGVEAPRSYGVLVEDSVTGRKMLAVIEQEMRRAGLPVTPYFVSADVGTAGSQGTQLAAKMRQDGINSVMLAILGNPAIAVLKAFDGQQYQPDLLVSDYGGYTIAFFGALYFSPQQFARTFGVGGPCIVCSRNEIDLTKAPDDPEGCPSCFMVENSNAYIEAYRQAGGEAANPQDGGYAFDMWAQLATLSIGILNGGDVLNAEAFAAGLAATETDRCDVWRFFGRDHPQNAPQGFFGGRHDAGRGTTTLYGVSERSWVGTIGYYESFDGYFRFDSLGEFPTAPTFDTGERGEYPFNKHEDTGIGPDVPC